jgi:serine/threonine protein kinase
MGPRAGSPEDASGAGTPTPLPERATCANIKAELICFLAPPQADDELGRLGPYRVLNVLGAGGMGVVYQAEDPQLKRLVALKAMLPAVAASPVNRQRFLREAQAAARLSHDNIVHIYQVGEDRDIPFLAMQFLRGETLETRILRDAPLPVGELLRVGREIAAGLAAAHENGLIHRDIKPANIWLEAASGARPTANGPTADSRPPLGRVKILDFGLARGTSEDTSVTQQGVIVGTPAYMAPEQASARPIDGRADLFSLGCLLYRASTRTLPFQGPDPMSILLALAMEEPKPPNQLNPDLPAALSELILKLLAKKPEDRFASAHEVVQALETQERLYLVEQTQLELAARIEIVPDEEPVEVAPIRTARTRPDRDPVAVPERAPTRPSTVRARAPERPRPRRKARSSGSTTRLVAVVALLAVFLVAGLVTFFTLRQQHKVQEIQSPAEPSGQTLVVRTPPPKETLKIKPPDTRDESPKGEQVPGPNRTSWQPVRTAKLYSTALRALAISPNGQLLATHGKDGKTIDCWNAHTGLPVQKFPAPAGAENIAFSPDGTKLAGFTGGHIATWDVPSGKVVGATPAPPLHQIVGMAFTADSRHLHFALAALRGAKQPGLVKVMDLATATAVATLGGKTGLVRHVLLTPDGRRAVCLDMDRRIHVYDLPSGRSVVTPPATLRQASCFALAPGGRKLYTSHHESRVRVWNLDTGEEMKSVLEGMFEIEALALSADGHFAVAGSTNGVVRVVELANGKVLHRYKGDSALPCVALSPDGTLAVTGDDTGTLQVFRVR